MNIALIGGGGSAHLLAVLLSVRGHRIRVLTSRPDVWSHTLTLKAAESELTGEIVGATADSTSILDGADVAFLCMPVHQYPNALAHLINGIYKNPHCIIGTVYGQGGFDWMVTHTCKGNGLPVCRHFAIGLLPWIVRVEEYGKKSISYGPKLRNGIACSDDETFAYLQRVLLDDLSYNYWGCGKFEKVPNFITLTLTVDNQIIHPSRCYGLMRESSYWESPSSIPYFYRDFDDFSTEILKGIDTDYTSVRDAYFNRVPRLRNAYDLDYLALEHWSYGSHNPDIRASFVHSETLREIRPPVVLGHDGRFRLDVEHRFFKDDFAYGLQIAQWFARQLNCDVPHIDMLIEWYLSEIQPRQKAILVPGVPTYYGITHELGI